MNYRIDIEQMIKALNNKYGVTAKYEEFERGYVAEIPVKNGNSVRIFFIKEGACIDKPNGTRKFHYEISNAKLIRYIDQTLEYYK